MANTLGAQIRDARKAARMTQAEVSEKLGVSVQAVSQWETDKTTPSYNKVRELSKIIGFNLDADPSTRDLMLPPHLHEPPLVKAPLVPWERHEEWGHLDIDLDNLRKWYPDEFLEVRWKPIGEVYALRLQTSSLRPEFVRGDDIIIDTGRAPEKGDVVVAKVKNTVIWGRYFPLGVDKHRAPIFEIRHNLGDTIDHVRVDIDNPGEVIGVVREQRRYFRTS